MELDAENLNGKKMHIFLNLEHGTEASFVHDEEIKFKANIRCNKLVGIWATEKLGLSGTAADTYVRNIVSLGLESPVGDNVFRKLRSDFDAAGVAQSDNQIHRVINEFMSHVLSDISDGAN